MALDILSALQVTIETVKKYVDNLVIKKADVAQDTSNAGKVWTVADDGGLTFSDGSVNGVQYVPQTLDEEQKLQARNNIGVGETIADTLISLELAKPLVEDDNDMLATVDGVILVYDKDEDKFVKTVNGIEPDENGNVEVEVGSGSGGGAFSWNDLEDKPFYEEVVDVVELYKNESLVFEESNGMYISQPAEELVLGDGKKYRINWDGTEYTCTCSVLGSNATYKMCSIGNLGMGNPNYENTGEPFLIQGMGAVGYDSYTFVIGTTSMSETHSITISEIIFVVHTLDEKFIPETVAMKSDVTWESLPDKPFSGNKTEIEWNGSTSYRDKVELDTVTYYRVSRTVPLKDELIGVTIEYSDGAIVELVQEDFVEGDGCLFVGDMLIMQRTVATLDGVEYRAPVPGCYAKNVDGLYISKFTYGIVTPIAAQYLTEVPVTSVNGMTGDVWTFPKITEADEGAVLRVVNGVPTWVQDTNI